MIHQNTNPATLPKASDIQIQVSRNLPAFLIENRLSLAITTYQAGKIMVLGQNEKGLHMVERSIPRCMGLAVDARAENMYVSGLYQVIRFVNALEQTNHPDFDRIYVPQAEFTTGDIDTHDMTLTPGGELIFVNTLFNCLCKLSLSRSFVPIWRPPVISELIAEDRCHLNGFCLDEAGQPAYATAVAETNVAGAWRDNRADGGIIMDIKANEIIGRNLSMPHSPRLHQGELYLHNAGSGHFGKFDRASATFEPIAFLPGFLRGLAFYENFALVAVSKKRRDKAFQGLALDENLSAEKVEARCGIYVIDLATGAVRHRIEFDQGVEEIFDVAVLPGVMRPNIIGFIHSEIQQIYCIGDETDILPGQ